MTASDTPLATGSPKFTDTRIAELAKSKGHLVAWWETIRQEMPAFMPDLTVTREMGIVAETFRKQNGVLRSDHPQI